MRSSGRVRAGMGAVVVGLVALVGACSESGSKAMVRNDTALPATEGGGAVGAAALRASGGESGDADDFAASPAGGGSGVSDEQTAGSPMPQGVGNAKIVKTAAIDLEVTDGGFDAAFSKVVTIAAANGGFVASSTSSSAGDGDGDDRQAAGTVVLRVPSENFDAARQALVALGDLRTQQVEGEDVGAQLTDLDARLRNLRSQEEAIRLLMTKAVNVGETLEVQRQLSAVREQIERLAAEEARLADSVALSTLTVSMAEPGVVVNESPANAIAEAFRRALAGAQSVLAAVIVALGYLLPLAMLVALAWLALRPVLARRGGRRQPEPAPVSP